MAMLTKGDIDFIHASRDEILAHREYEISVIYLVKQYDPINGLPISESEESRAVRAIVTEISSAMGASADRKIEGGVKYIEGDVKFDVSIELIEDIAKQIERIDYDGGKYEILAIDKKGIGRRNRYEIIGRLIA